MGAISDLDQFCHDWFEVLSGPEHEWVDAHATLGRRLAAMHSVQ